MQLIHRKLYRAGFWIRSVSGPRSKSNLSDNSSMSVLLFFPLPIWGCILQNIRGMGMVCEKFEKLVQEIEFSVQKNLQQNRIILQNVKIRCQIAIERGILSRNSILYRKHWHEWSHKSSYNLVLCWMKHARLAVRSIRWHLICILIVCLWQYIATIFQLE